MNAPSADETRPTLANAPWVGTCASATSRISPRPSSARPAHENGTIESPSSASSRLTPPTQARQHDARDARARTRCRRCRAGRAARAGSRRSGSAAAASSQPIAVELDPRAGDVDGQALVGQRPAVDLPQQARDATRPRRSATCARTASRRRPVARAGGAGARASA